MYKNATPLSYKWFSKYMAKKYFLDLFISLLPTQSHSAQVHMSFYFNKLQQLLGKDRFGFLPNAHMSMSCRCKCYWKEICNALAAQTF